MTTCHGRLITDHTRLDYIDYIYLQRAEVARSDAVPKRGHRGVHREAHPPGEG
jgi:hypothetical protein